VDIKDQLIVGFHNSCDLVISTFFIPLIEAKGLENILRGTFTVF
jgi:hypothetical protein